MKNFLLILLLTIIISPLNSFSQEVFLVKDSVVTGKGYSNDVWYNLDYGVIKEDPSDNWDLAFHIDGRRAGILINSTKGIVLWHIVNSSSDDFEKPVDTTGLSTDNGSKFKSYINSQEKWYIGAFNLGLCGFDNGDGNYGCLQYDMATHTLAGTSVYILKLADGSYKKAYVEALLGNIYYFNISNLDNSNKEAIEINKTNYANKVFTYLDLSTNTIIDREPAKEDWDLLFGKYLGLTSDNQGNFVPYALSGARSNDKLWISKVDDADRLNVAPPTFNIQNYSNSITTIGADWKTFNSTTFKYEINNNWVYFISRDNPEFGPTNTIYRLAFTGFGGSGTGLFAFNPGVSSVIDFGLNNNSITTIPNVINRTDIATVTNSDGFHKPIVKVYSSNGEEVSLDIFVATNEISIRPILLSPGLYLIRIVDGANVYSSSIMVR